MTESIDILEDEDPDEPELYEWSPACIDDCEMCGCHGDCDPEDRWRWANEDEEEDD